MPRYQIHAVTLHTTDLNAGSIINIGGETQMDVATGTQTMSDDSGSVYDETRSMVSQAPEVTLRAKSLATWLTHIGLGGYCIASDGSHPGLRCYGAALNDCKSPPAAGVNLRYTVGKGLIVLGQLSATRGQDAQLTLQVHTITDGTNAPLAGAYTSITLPTGLATQQFTLGVCKVGNVTLTDLESMTLDFGVRVTAKAPAMGLVWPDSIAVREIQPVATFVTYDPTVLDAAIVPLAGKQATHAQTIIQLKKRLGYSAFVADGTAEHLRLTMNGMLTVTKAFGGSGNAEGTAELRLEGVHDGTNVPILFNLASTYTSTP